MGEKASSPFGDFNFGSDRIPNIKIDFKPLSINGPINQILSLFFYFLIRILLKYVRIFLKPNLDIPGRDFIGTYSSSFSVTKIGSTKLSLLGSLL